jgi:hypothetical protein
MMEAGLVLGQRRGQDGVLAIMAADADLPIEWLTRMSLVRPERLDDDEATEPFLQRIDEWLRRASERLQPELQEEPVRLLRKKEQRAALISAVALLETRLRMSLAKPSYELAPSHVPVSKLLRIGEKNGVISRDAAAALRRAVTMRNEVLHTGAHFSPTEATRAVNAIMEFLNDFPAPVF